jgi:sugar phosphate isomerase/epimerase
MPTNAAVPRPIGLQLWTLRQEAATDFENLLRTVSGIGFAGVEPAGLYGRRGEAVRKLTDSLGLEVPAAHISFNGDDYLQQLDEHAALGVPVVISNGLPEEFVNAATIAAAAERFNTAQIAARERGLSLGYHNHWWEFDHQIDDASPYKLFVDDLDGDVPIEVDLYWVATAGVDPAALIAELGETVRFLHVKDGPAALNEPMVALGTGSVDLVPALNANPSVEWHIVELDNCATDMLTAVRESYRYLVDAQLSTGRAAGGITREARRRYACH